MTEDSTNHELMALENRLRAELPALAESLLAEEGELADERRLARDGQAALVDRDQMSDGRRFTSGGVAKLAAAVVGALLVGAGALWATADRPNQIEAAFDSEDGPDVGDEPSGDVGAASAGWAALPDTEARLRAHALSVWTGTEALFWGGRIDIGGPDSATTEAVVGGVAYNPESGSWREIAAPEWGHPGANGVYHEGWVYVLAKGRVTRFDPVSGDEQDIDVPAKFGGASTALFVLRDRVWVMGVLNRGPVVIPIDPASGQLVDADLIPIDPEAVVMELLTVENGSLAVFNDDLYVVSLGSLFRIDGQTGQSTLLVDPSGVPEPGGLRVFAGETNVIVVSVDGTLVNIGTVDERDGVAFYEQPVEVESAAEATIVAAGDWLTVLPNGKAPVSVHLVEGEQFVHEDSPLAGHANANAVWTGRELVVWGGQGQPAVPDGTDGARWVPPFVPLEEEATEDVIEEAGGVETATDEPVTACALLGDSLTLTEQPDLPDAVAATRQAIFAAAMACDFERLIELGVNTETSFGGGSFAENLDVSPGGRGAVLIYLVGLLNLPFGVQEFAQEQVGTEAEGDNQSQVIYSWPSAFTDESEDGSGIPADELAALTDLYGPTFLTELQDFGGYAKHRVGIESDGTWIFFIAGD